MESFSDKLKNLGFKPAVSVPNSNKKHRITLEEKIGGCVVSNSLGEFVLKEENYPTGYRHGNVIFRDQCDSDALQRIARLSRAVTSLEQYVFLDTETSGLSGGTGTFAFLVGIGQFRKTGFLLQQFIIRDPLEEGAMLLNLANSIHDTDVFVTYNGKSFDLPILLNRYRLNRLPVDFKANDHLDLLHVARKIWKNQLPACGLKDMERDVIKFTRTDEDIPGWLIPDIYFDYLRSNDPEKISNVVYHNAIDVVSLAALFLHTSCLINQNNEHGDMTAGDLIALGKAYADIGEIQKAINIYAKLRDLFPTDTLSCEVSLRMGSLYKKLEDLDSSLVNWTMAAEQGKLEACIELSKYFEHKIRDFKQALTWAIKAEIIAYDIKTDKRLSDSIRHRIERIERKAGKNV